MSTPSSRRPLMTCKASSFARWETSTLWWWNLQWWTWLTGWIWWFSSTVVILNTPFKLLYLCYKKSQDYTLSFGHWFVFHIVQGVKKYAFRNSVFGQIIHQWNLIIWPLSNDIQIVLHSYKLTASEYWNFYTWIKPQNLLYLLDIDWFLYSVEVQRYKPLVFCVTFWPPYRPTYVSPQSIISRVTWHFLNYSIWNLKINVRLTLTPWP